jgi:hypothetical protein
VFSSVILAAKGWRGLLGLLLAGRRERQTVWRKLQRKKWVGDAGLVIVGGAMCGSLYVW